MLYIIKKNQLDECFYLQKYAAQGGPEFFFIVNIQVHQ